MSNAEEGIARVQAAATAAQGTQGSQLLQTSYAQRKLPE